MTLVLAFVAFAFMAAAQTLPPGFAQQKLSTGLGFTDNNANIPTKIQFLPDGRILYCVRLGKFYISPSNLATLSPTLLLDLQSNTNSNGELGYARSWRVSTKTFTIKIYGSFDCFC
jgi:hypothetical protein